MDKGTAKGKLRVVDRNGCAQAVQEALAGHGQALLPMLELIDNAQATIDELMHDAARALICLLYTSPSPRD